MSSSPSSAQPVIVALSGNQRPTKTSHSDGGEKGKKMFAKEFRKSVFYRAANLPRTPNPLGSTLAPTSFKRAEKGTFHLHLSEVVGFCEGQESGHDVQTALWIGLAFCCGRVA